MENILFQNVEIVDRDSPWHGKRADVLVEGGKIIKLAAPGSLGHGGPSGHGHGNLQVVKGGCLSPGWVDMRCQLSDPGYEQREDLHSLAAAAAGGGFTRILTQPNSLPVMDNAGQVRALLGRAASLPIHVHVCGALSVGAAGKDLAELYDMHVSGALAFTDGRKGTQSAGLLLRGLQYVQPFDGLVISSPVDQLLAEDSMVADGLSAVRMGLKGIPAIAEQLMVDRDLRLLDHARFKVPVGAGASGTTHKAADTMLGRLHIGPVTTAEALAVVREAKALGARFTVETSALYLLLDASENEAFDAVTKVYPPLRERASVQALREAVADGTIDVVSSGHHPQGREEKTHDFVDASFGADCLETAYAAISTAMKDVSHKQETIIAALSHAPRAILGLPPATIREGSEAELTHFDPEAAWTPEANDIRSKSKYNPLIGRELKGKVLGIYVKGQFRNQAQP